MKPLEHIKDDGTKYARKPVRTYLSQRKPTWVDITIGCTHA